MPPLKFKVVDRKDKLLCEFQDFSSDASDKSTLLDLMKHIIKKSDYLSKKKNDINRMRLTVGNAKGRPITDKKQLVSSFFTSEEMNGEIVLVFKDLGLQISWTLVFLIEYFGPILITAILVLFQKQIYGKSKPYLFNQKLGLAMVVGHYMKRELETLFVHRFSNETMPFFNVFKNSAHYWILNGFCSMYFFLHPDYTPPSWATDKTHMIFAVLFCLFEFMNLMCHITLRNLRKPGSSERGIPTGWGFDFVSCANYYWESLCWFTFALMSQVLGAYLFFFVSSFQMLDWAIKKHQRYKKDFGAKYPKRKAMYPFII